MKSVCLAARWMVLARWPWNKSSPRSGLILGRHLCSPQADKLKANEAIEEPRCDHGARGGQMSLSWRHAALIALVLTSALGMVSLDPIAQNLAPCVMPGSLSSWT